MRQQWLCDCTAVFSQGWILVYHSHPVHRWWGQLGWAGWFSWHSRYCKLGWTDRATTAVWSLKTTGNRDCHWRCSSSDRGSRDGWWTLPADDWPLFSPGWPALTTCSCWRSGGLMPSLPWSHRSLQMAEFILPRRRVIIRTLICTSPNKLQQVQIG